NTLSVFGSGSGVITSGNIHVQQGNLNIFGTIVNGTGSFTFDDSTSLSLRAEYAGNFTRQLQLGGRVTINGGSTSDANVNYVIDSPVSVGSFGVNAGRITFQPPSGTSTTWTNNITETSPSSIVVNSNGGTLNLSGNNAFTGGTTVTAGTLVMGSNNALG